MSIHVQRYTQEVRIKLFCPRTNERRIRSHSKGKTRREQAKKKGKPKSPLVIAPEARESARSAGWLMVRHSPAYFTGHI